MPRCGASPGILAATHEGELSDPDNELCGTLLDRLYPGVITPSQVWRYVRPRNQSDLVGRFWRFWEYTLEERSSDQQVAELLDAFYTKTLHDSALSGRSHRFGELPLRLLGDEAWRLIGEQHRAVAPVQLA